MQDVFDKCCVILQSKLRIAMGEAKAAAGSEAAAAAAQKKTAAEKAAADAKAAAEAKAAEEAKAKAEKAILELKNQCRVLEKEKGALQDRLKLAETTAQVGQAAAAGQHTEQKVSRFEKQGRKLEEEITRISEQRDALRVELKDSKKKEQDSSARLHALNTTLKEQAGGFLKSAKSGTTALVAAESFSRAVAALSERTELAQKSAHETLGRRKLALAIPLVGRAFGRMQRRQELGLIMLSWEGWLGVVESSAKNNRNVSVSVARALKGWVRFSVETNKFRANVQVNLFAQK
jgi:hypothetical protein